MSAAYEQGLEKARQGDLEGALQDFRRAFREEESGRVHAALGNTYHLLGDRENALENLERACELEPQSAEHRSDLAAVLAERGMTEHAALLYQDAIDLDPGNAEHYHRLGHLLARSGQDATAAFQAAVSRSPFQAAYRTALARALYRQGRYEEAAEQAGQARRLGDAGATEIHTAACFAARDFEGCAAVPDESPRGLLLRGRALGHLDRHEEALDCFGRAARLQPEEPEPYRRQGAVYAKLELHDRAAAAFRKLTFLTPQDATAWYNLGTALLHAGDPGGAAEALHKAVAQGHAEAAHNLELAESLR